MRLNRRLQKTLAVAALATMTVTALPTTTYASDYNNHWAKATIEKWSTKEVLKGYEDGSFKPNGTVTRGELAAILVRVFGLNEVAGAAVYTDVVPTKWYAGDVAKVSVAGIMNDYEDGTFKPEQEATREEAAYAIAKAYRVATQDKTSSFTDQAQISDWAEDEIAALVAGGYLNGNPDGSFRPQATLTRAEAVTMVDKITADLVNVAGVYSQDIEGNLVVNTTGVELKDMTITGNLYLAEGIGEGEVKLTNVTVLGDVIVEGGSVNTIKVEGESKLNNILVDKAGKNPVRLLFGNLVQVNGKVTLESTSTLEGNVLSLKEVVIDGAKEVHLVGGMKIETITINKTTELALVDGPAIQLVVINKEAPATLIRGRGAKGSIRKMIIHANDVELKKGFKLNKDYVTLGEGVTGTKFPESGGGGGGGGGSTGGGNNNGGGEQQENKVTLDKLKVTTAQGTKEVSLTSTTINVEVSNAGITVNGTSVANTTDEIQGITVTGKNTTGTVKVGVLGKSTILNLGNEYKVAALKQKVEDNYDAIKARLEKAVEDKILSQDTYEAAVRDMETVYDQLMGDITDTVSLGDINKAIDTANTLLKTAKPERVKEVQDVIDGYLEQAEVLEGFGLKITGLGNISAGIKEVSIKGVPVTLEQEGKDLNKYIINVTYK